MEMLIRTKRAHDLLSQLLDLLSRPTRGLATRGLPQPDTCDRM